MIASRQPHYLVTANVDFLVQAQADAELRRVLNEAHLVLCDGTPLVWASRLLGNPLPERVAGSDLVPVLLKLAAEKMYRVFFLGATLDSVEQAVSRLKEQYPSLNLAGHYSPPFRRLLRMDHEEIKRRIKEAQPDLLFIAFGCPKAEKWMSMHYRDLGVPVVMGVGGTIDFLAGKVKRAPRWMQRAGMEWIFRMACEPRRLFRRYMGDLWGFGWRIALQWLFLQWIPHLSHHARERVGRCWDATRYVGRHCIVDLSDVPFVDSTDVGILIEVQKKLRAAGRHFVLASINPGVQRALALMGLEHHFTVASDVTAAERVIETLSSEESTMVTRDAREKTPGLEWRGEITAATAVQFWERTKALISNVAKPSPVAIDLSNARFVDSSGVTTMVRIQRWAWSQGKKVVFTGASPGVRTALRKAELELLLLEKPELTGLMADSVVSCPT
jgi:N-acetylglucosaminyldiphosphoundecaprenol N-acetyl-beta-D-mannosaminyltransferase